MQNLLSIVVKWSVLAFHSQRWIAVRVQVQRRLYENVVAALMSHFSFHCQHLNRPL